MNLKLGNGNTLKILNLKPLNSETLNRSALGGELSEAKP